MVYLWDWRTQRVLTSKETAIVSATSRRMLPIWSLFNFKLQAWQTPVVASTILKEEDDWFWRTRRKWIGSSLNVVAAVEMVPTKLPSWLLCNSRKTEFHLLNSGGCRLDFIRPYPDGVPWWPSWNWQWKRPKRDSGKLEGWWAYWVAYSWFCRVDGYLWTTEDHAAWQRSSEFCYRGV